VIEKAKQKPLCGTELGSLVVFLELQKKKANSSTTLSAY